MKRILIGVLGILLAGIVFGADHSAGVEGSGRLGVGMECLDRDLWKHGPAMPHLKELGVTRVRLQSGWARTEKVKGVYDFKWLDEIVDDLTAIGVEPWISLSYGNPIYAVAKDGEQDYTGQKMFPLNSDQGISAWQNYVRAIVARYKDRVRVWEIWNEPDCLHFLRVPEGTSWAAEYAKLARMTATVVREVQPTARIAVCTASGPDGRERRSVELFEQGVGEFADIYTFHAYRALPEGFSRQERDAFYGAIRRYAPKIEFWRGEAGLSSQKSGRGALHHLPLSEEMQARWMTRHLVRDMADPEISFTSYFHLFDFDHYTHEVTYHYGVLRDKDYSHKPSFAVLQRIKKFFDDGETMPDSTASFALEPVKNASAQDEAILAGAAVYVFRRRGQPLFAVTSTWPTTEAMPTVKARGRLFCGDATGQWKDPVLLDLVDGSVKRLALAKDWPSPVVRFELANHIRVITEASALEPHLHISPGVGLKAAEIKPSAQKVHE